jgi:hypothetical protein
MAGNQFGVAVCAALNIDPLMVRGLMIQVTPGEPVRVLVDWMAGSADEETLGVAFDIFEFEPVVKD